MKNYISIRTMSANNLEEAVNKVIDQDFTEENLLCDAVLPEALIHVCSSEKGRVFWVIEESDQGRIDHFCNLDAIPEIWHENSKFQFRQLWNHVFTRIPLWQLNEFFEANRIKFRFKK